MDQKIIDDIIQWDIKNWSKLIDLWTPIIAKNKSKKALALGEREGGLSLWLALKDLKVTCSDYNEFNESPLKLHVKHNVQDKIIYSQENAIQLSYPDNTFDIVIFKSMLGALKNSANQKKALKESYRVLKPKGILLFAENLKSTKVHDFARKKFTNWGERWHYPTLEEIKKHCEFFESFQYETHGFLSPFGRTEIQRQKLSSIDHVVKPITPKKWRSILFGIATK